MNYIIDVIILLCLGYGAFKGFRKGFIIQSFVILALVLAIWCGFAFAGKLEPFMQKHFDMSEFVCSIVSFIVIFILVLLLAYTSGYLVSKVADATALGLINRLAGAAFGILANALVLSVLIILFNRVNDNKTARGKEPFIKKETLDKTFLYKPVGKVAPAIFPEKFFKRLLD